MIQNMLKGSTIVWSLNCCHFVTQIEIFSLVDCRILWTLSELKKSCMHIFTLHTKYKEQLNDKTETQITKSFHLHFVNFLYFFLKILFLNLNLEVFYVVDILHKFVKFGFSSLKILLNFFLVLFYPFYELPLPFWLFLQSLLFQKLLIKSLLIPKIRLIDYLPELLFALLRCSGHLSFEHIFDAWQIFGSSKVTISSESWYLMSLGVVHFRIFNGSIVIASQLLYPNLPMVQLS